MTFANWRTAAKGFKLYKGLIPWSDSKLLKRFCWINNRLEEFFPCLWNKKKVQNATEIYISILPSNFLISAMYVPPSFLSYLAKVWSKSNFLYAVEILELWQLKFECCLLHWLLCHAQWAKNQKKCAILGGKTFSLK